MNELLVMSAVVAYFALLPLISFFIGGRGDNDTFFRGGRRSPWYAVAFGMVGSSLSGVSFVSVPGMVRESGLTYLQMCMGCFFGYLVVAFVLLPLYYRLNLTSIYAYLRLRFGACSCRTGASFFLLGKLVGSAVKLYLVCFVLQRFVFDGLGIPFELTAVAVLFLVWLYTRRSGLRTLVWMDCVQTFVLLTALILILVGVTGRLELTASEAWRLVSDGPYGKVFEWEDWASPQHLVKQFASGIFVVIVMTGLDQDMMQKNLSCRTLREAQWNMCTCGACFLPVNALFLALGVLLVAFASQVGVTLPPQGDEVLPLLCAEGYLGTAAATCFAVGILAAAFNSADSALTALTTSFCVDIVRCPADERLRHRVHAGMAMALLLFVMLFRTWNNGSMLDAVYTLVGYTYGPLLGLFAFGLLTRRIPRENGVPVVAVAAPLLCYAADRLLLTFFDYRCGYELLMFNGMLTFVGLLLLSVRRTQE